MSRNAKFIENTIEIAMTSKHPKWKLGCMLVKGNRVLAVATNSFRNSPLINSDAASYHAEQAAIRSLERSTGVTYGRGRFKGVVLCVARVHRSLDSVRLARPCRRCMVAIMEAGIREIVYTNELGQYSVEVI